ncbi:tRNA-dependent cyclodipeptide synthase [Streptomyces subrutilus]|uniref:tRNA-dependent cyclodipeptide synthase n=1 Tax=Streptomyces subrutilus TaxID=36818 RepID=UPI0034083BCE
MFSLSPLSGGETFFPDRCDHALIGLSPWNGRYSRRYIEALVTWAHARFPRVDVFTPGYEAAHTLVAAGFATAEAVHRARRAGTQLRNPALRALRDAGMVQPERHVHTWTQLHARPAYTRARHRVQLAYAADPAVRRACRRTAREAVRGAGRSVPDESAIDLAVGYALAELPLVTEGPSIFDVSSSVFLYHRDMELVHPLVSGESKALVPHPGQRYAIATWEDETP